jgi:hypothetical protein
MVLDPRICAIVLFAPDSSAMADNARRWWAGDPAAAGPLGTPAQNPAGYAHVSPRRYFRRGQPPVLLVQGTADEQIPAVWTTATYRALRRAGVKTRLVWIPGAPHIMAGADLAGENAAAEAWIRQALGSGASGAAAYSGLTAWAAVAFAVVLGFARLSYGLLLPAGEAPGGVALDEHSRRACSRPITWMGWWVCWTGRAAGCCARSAYAGHHVA